MKPASSEKIRQQVNVFLDMEYVNSHIMMTEMRKLGFSDEESMEVLELYSDRNNQRSDKKIIEIKEKNEKKEKLELANQNLLDFVAVFAGLTCFVISAMSLYSFWSMIILVIASVIVGYRLSSDMPLAGIVGILVFCLLNSYFMPMYMESRERVFKIEGYIIFGVPAIPAYLLYYVIRQLGGKGN